MVDGTVGCELVAIEMTVLFWGTFCMILGIAMALHQRRTGWMRTASSEALVLLAFDGL